VQAYGSAFAHVYNLRWAGYAQQVAPRLLDWYADLPLSQTNRSILDLGCGTGQLALYCLEQGYHVTGLDLSEAMLAYARENVQAYVQTGQAKFVQGDATRFSLAERFGLVLSTYDALNHLADLPALGNCFRCVRAVLDPAGYFIFDLNTRRGLRQRWNSVQVEESDELALITRGIYDGVSDRAWMKISGFLLAEGGLYERFEETVFNTAFELVRVREALLESGWETVYFARLQDLKTPLADPESEGRVFVVAGPGG
jgi:SAM-dependent methyltransferase